MSLSGHFATFFVGAVSLPVLWSLAEAAIEGSSLSLVAPDVPVDGFVTDVKYAEATKSAAHLLGAEVGLEQLFDHLPVFGREMTVPSGTLQAKTGELLRSVVSIAAVGLAAVALEFSSDGAAVAAHVYGDRSVGEAWLLLSQRR